MELDGIFQFHRCQLLECSLCPDQKREATESTEMSSNRLVLDKYIVSIPKMTLELKLFSFTIVNCWSVRCVQTKKERVLRVQR